MVALLVMGIAQFILRRTARSRGQDPIGSGSGTLDSIHTWAGRLLWLILLVTAGLWVFHLAMPSSCEIQTN